ILSANPPKVNPGDPVTLQLVDNAGVWVIKKIGPGAKDAAFQTGKDLLQQNLEKKKAEDAAAAQVKKEDDEAQARMAENAAYAKQLAEDAFVKDQVSKMCLDCEHTAYCPTHDCKGGCGTEAAKFKPKAPEGGIDGIVAATRANAEKAMEASGAAPTVQTPMEPEKPAPVATATAPHVNPGAKVTVNPVIINDTLRQAPADPTECPVELKIHLDCGSYSNFDLSAPAMPIDQAIARIEADGLKAIAMMHRMMASSKKGF
ncbi:MAG: hypothetical protein WC428_08500, partial [Candidatus Paceibacterota bacterium]